MEAREEGWVDDSASHLDDWVDTGPAQGTINKTKRRPAEREEMLANSVSAKGLRSKTHKELIQQQNNNINNNKSRRNPVSKWAGQQNRRVSKDDTAMTDRPREDGQHPELFSSVQSLSRVRLFATP